MEPAGLYDLPPTAISRELFFNVGGPHGFMRWGVYLFLLASLLFLGYTLWVRIRLWRKGQSEACSDHPLRRLHLVVKYVLLQAKVMREGYTGLMHASLFYGFVALTFVTGMIVLQEDISAPLFDVRFIYGNFYLIWSLLADLFGLALLGGLGLAAYRRYIVRPGRLDTRPTDTLALLLLALIVVTGFFSEAMRIAITGFPPFEVFSPVGFMLAQALTPLGAETLRALHYGNWWLHMLASFGFIGLVASGKLGHIVIATLNIYFGRLDNECPATLYSSTLIRPDEFETADTFGATTVTDFSWKQLLDVDACTRCGRCQDHCPAWLTDKPLSPKLLVNAIQGSLQALAGGGDNKPLVGNYVQLDEIWSCTNCAACMEVCPVNIEQVPKVLELRRARVLMEGEMAPELQRTFVNLENNGNPYGFAFAKRGDWLPDDLGFKTLAEDPDVDYLYFAGCAAAYDKRNQRTAIAFMRILKQAGYKVGILGPEEVCCGDSALRAGNEYLFQTLAGKNLESFARYGVRKAVVTCPHGLNTLKKEYRKFAALGVAEDGSPLRYDISVEHHTQVIHRLLKEDRIRLKQQPAQKITYHDSCFLGRYNDILDTPREILAAIPGSEVVEMERHGKNSFCCGAGGSRMWLEESLGSRINQTRTREAQATVADLISTACPFCSTMLSDGVKELAIDTLETRDIAELVYEAMEK
ncbi:MAG: 4Fe-4S dicluster domain-containing protein [gamma proteobacterium endosymbiont of Lamellibrachia anaximandri]|nr:4Fe-4S dicluster domain-containing protein [gamma proteobacterium endosymbiont of Lamellibrachia anaximandri]MBL3618177.1 4Fe-4S dicluster domain-containing protein [gamma proteobacterium endosymbiont of Lamellibrachia anaximandri]